jgi:adenylate cyclase
MALFGVESTPEIAARQAVRSALLMQAELERLNRHAGKLGALQMGVGIHFGQSVLGLIGSAQHRSYTALGDTVNFASRMEGMTKQLGATVLVSGAVLKHLNKSDFVLRALGKYAPKGAAMPIECFDVMGEARDAAVTGPLAEELERSRNAAQLAAEHKLEEAVRELRRAIELSRGTHRETGYRLRIATHEAGDSVVRLHEK